MAKENGGAAFGFSTIPDPDGDTKVKPAGMTLRDYFAAQALSALFSDPNLVSTAFKSVHSPDATMASWAYQFADAMLAERSK